MSRHQQLLAENTKLRDALAYYASKSIWKRIRNHPPGTPKRFDPAPVTRDKGHRARATLLELQRKQPPLSLRGLLRRTFTGRDGGQ